MSTCWKLDMFLTSMHHLDDMYPCCRSRRYGAARDCYRICLAHCPEDRNVLLSSLAIVFIKLQRWQQALSCAQSVLKTEPDHFKCLSRAGFANIHLERYHSAVKCLQKALKQVSAAAIPCVSSMPYLLQLGQAAPSASLVHQHATNRDAGIVCPQR